MFFESPLWIANILEQHVEDLAALWEQRLANMAAPGYGRRSFRLLDARILAHLDALVLAREEAHPFILPLLTADYPGALTAGLALLLAEHDPAAQARHVIEALKVAAGPALDGLCQALAWAPPAAFRHCQEAVTALAKEGAPPMAAPALGVLAAHNALRGQESALDRLLGHTEPPVRFAAWRVAQYLAVPRPTPVYQVGINDPDPLARGAALHAAAWAAQRGVVTACRAAAKNPTLEALPLLELFAVLAEAADVGAIVNLAGAKALGPVRFDVMGRSGFPAAAPLLIEAMKSKDAPVAAAASAAFAQLTGFDPAGSERVSLATSQDPFEQAFAPEVTLPDVPKAEKFWSKQGSALAGLPRIARGVPVDPATPPVAANLAALDCRSYLDVHLRHFYQANAPKRAPDFMAFSLTA